jgi:hypothetical protein
VLAVGRRTHVRAKQNSEDWHQTDGQDDTEHSVGTAPVLETDPGGDVGGEKGEGQVENEILP